MIHLSSHLGYLDAADVEFRDSWRAHGARCHETLWQLVQSAACLQSGRTDWIHHHLRAVSGASCLLNFAPDADFAVHPRPEHWIRRVRSASLTHLVNYWRYRIAKIARDSVPYANHFYGGQKRSATVERRIFEWRIAPSRDSVHLDLWDAASFRVVVPCLRSMADLLRVLLDELRHHLVRCRNYYQRPRDGRDDPYRAVHLELQADDEDFVELQVVTARREAVGLIDHKLVHKRSLPFWSRGHERWLQEVSWTANLLDVRGLI